MSYCRCYANVDFELSKGIHNNENVKLKLIFTASNDEGDIRGTAARHLLAINKSFPSKTKQALDDWYLADKKDSATADRYDLFSKKYPPDNYRENGEIKEQEGEIEKMKEWCREAEISFTPTIYVNGYRLPEKYNPDSYREKN